MRMACCINSRFVAPVGLIVIVCLSALLGAGAKLGSDAKITPALGRVVLPVWPVDQPMMDWPVLDRLMARVPLSDEGRMIVDARTMVLLEATVAGMPQPLAPETRERIRFLLNQGLLKAEGSELADLLFRFADYRAARLQAPHSLALPELERLQSTYFGEATGQALFRQHNAMQQAMVDEAYRRERRQ